MHNVAKKVNVYIDWFNFYYALKNKLHDENSQWRKEYQWCNFRQLFSEFLKENEVLNTVYFFSAYRTWNDGVTHKIYVEALMKYNIRPILGNYQSKTNAYKQNKHKIVNMIYNGDEKEQENCQKSLKELVYKTFEEKETDVKIALQVLEDAFLNNFDHAYIVSWDSDITPALYSIKRLVKEKRLQHKLFSSILISWTKGRKIRELCDFQHEITAKHMGSSVLPHTIQINAQRSISIPPEWLLE